MPAVKSSGQPTEIAEDEHAKSLIATTENDGRGERNERDNRNKRKRTKHDAAIAVNETITEMQESQEQFMERFFSKIEAMDERAEEKNNQFLLKLIEAIKK